MSAAAFYDLLFLTLQYAETQCFERCHCKHKFMGKNTAIYAALKGVIQMGRIKNVGQCSLKCEKNVIFAPQLLCYYGNNRR